MDTKKKRTGEKQLQNGAKKDLSREIILCLEAASNNDGFENTVHIIEI